MELELPHNLERAAAGHDDPGFAAWAGSLGPTVEAMARRWSLTLEAPFQPGGQTAWVAPVRDAAGERLALKVGWRHEEALHEAEGLRAWGGEGAVLLRDALMLERTSALLLELCEPGTTLSDSLPPEEQDAVVATLLLRLRIPPPAGDGFRTLASMCSAWADEFEARSTAATMRRAGLDPGVARAGIELLRTLPHDAERSVLLSTDLHADNVLAARREPWLAIDPKPHVGDPAFDALQHMLNCPDRLGSDPLAFARRMAELLELDPERLRLWLVARCVQESVDQPELGRVAATLAP